jgi:hypothetical protein
MGITYALTSHLMNDRGTTWQRMVESVSFLGLLGLFLTTHHHLTDDIVTIVRLMSWRMMWYILV